MALVLLVDPNETARKAMKGILARGGHACALADSAKGALEIIRRNPRVDLVFTELKLAGGEGGLSFIKLIRTNRLLGQLPIVVYTEHPDRDVVKRALDLHVQNFLIKPFQDEAIFTEIERAEHQPWRAAHFEEEKSFCRLMGLSTVQLHRMLDGVRQDLQVALGAIEQGVALRNHGAVLAATAPLRAKAEEAGAWCVVEALTQLTEHSSAGAWTSFPADKLDLELAVELIAHALDPQRACPDFLGEPDAPVDTLAQERNAWLAAPAASTCPLVTWEQLQREIDALAGCPVIDSAAASFQMVANGHPSCINPLMDLVARDPGLSVQMLVAANRAHPPADEFSRIEDARLAVGQLGEMRLLDEARKLVQIDARTFALAPAMTWSSYWTFQRAVARIAQLICRDLEFHSLEAVARTAGQMHDIGLLLLARLRPAGFQAVLEHARVHRQPRRAVEKLFLGCTTAQMAAHFGERAGLSRRFVNVLRWTDDSASATEDKHLIAIISLARDLCRQNEVGTSGDPLVEDATPLEATPEWVILREGLYPSFNLKKFEQQVNAYCKQLRAEFSGHQAGTVGELVARAAG
jgi:CheY-like chemotaxis protein/HD-like signal output (HDOD) protein